jgi:hypothetical protein
VSTIQTLTAGALILGSMALGLCAAVFLAAGVFAGRGDLERRVMPLVAAGAAFGYAGLAVNTA